MALITTTSDTAMGGRDAVALIARLLLSLMFIMSGFGKIAGFADTAGYIASKGLPLPEVGAALAILVELGGGLMLLLGFKARWAGLVMALFTLVAAVIFHPYWQDPAGQQMGNYLNFWKNLVIAGGLLMVFAFGPGRYSIDRG